MRLFKSLFSAALVLILLISAVSLTARADKAEFEYKLTLTDGDGRSVTNPRNLAAGDTLNVEIELTRADTNATSYETYGLEFRLMTRGLEYNHDGASFRSGTPVKLLQYDSGDSVGFAYYDMEQKGERIANPVLAGRWSYTVTNPNAVNITVPVALMYVVKDSESYEVIGNAKLILDVNGGELLGPDVSGEYRSGTIVKLPDARRSDYKFRGWSDGERVYPADSNYSVSGFVTLTAEWEPLQRTRQIIFDAQGGEIVGEDPTGMYADGEIIVMPEAKKKDWKLTGWDDAVTIRPAGEEYVVDNSKVFRAVWEPAPEYTVKFDPAGGTITGNDPSGTYKEGEEFIIPSASREDFTFEGWELGEGLYKAGERYTVKSDVTFTAKWKEVSNIDENESPLSKWLHDVFSDPDGNIDPWKILGAILGLLALGLGIWWLIILWKRKWVKYSLVNGDVALDFKDSKHSVRVEVLLLDGRKHYTLTKSGLVEKKHKLRFIKATRPVITELKKGRYEGRLILTNDEGFTERKKCRVKVLEKELKEKKND